MSEAAAGAPAPGDTLETAPRRAIILATAMLATAMSAIDLTIAGVALPYMQGSFSETQDRITWVLTSYIVATAVALPATGWLSARFGRRRLFMVALIGFTAISALCGLARSLETEVLYRALQGLFGAPLVPLSQAIIMDSFPREQHGKALGIWGLGLMLGPIIGPTLGGYLTQEYGWPFIYYINVPLGIITVIGVIVAMPRTKRDKDSSLDWLGFLTLGIGIASMQLMLDRGERLDWFESYEIMAEAALAALCFYWFAVHIATGRNTFLSRELLKDRNFVTGLLLVFIFGFILLPPLMLLPPFLQELRNYPVAYTGAMISIRGFGVLFGMQLGGFLVGRSDTRVVLLIGVLAFAAGGWPMTQWTLEVGEWDVIWTGMLQSFGLGLFYVPLLAASFSTLPARLRTEGTGFFQLMRNVGSSISVTMFAILLVRNTTVSRAGLVENVTPYSQAFQRPLFGDAWSLTSPRGLAALDHEITRQAAMIAYANDFYLIVLCSLAMVPLIFLMRPSPVNK
jgi:DHA2 family multidrug resistance protein